jgi:hypothetical protein
MCPKPGDTRPRPVNLRVDGVLSVKGESMTHKLHSRPDKLDDAQTVLYEIDMLRLSKNRLDEGKFQSDADEWIYLEAFLLHFRNLIEFFRGKISRDTLTISRPSDFLVKTPDVSKLVRPDLWAKYEERKKTEENDKISRYLQHCTKQRVIKKKWNVEEMYSELKPLIEKFESLLPEYKPATKPFVFKVTKTLGDAEQGSSTASTRTIGKS